MEASRRSFVALAALGLMISVLLAAAPARADMHAACDTQRPEAEGGFGPAAYANTLLAQDPEGGFTYGGGVYCPGAVVTIESVAVTEVGADGPLASTSADPCTSDAATACTAQDGLASLAPGSYEVTMVFDADDPNTDGLEYDDTVRSQTFTWLGAGQPVATCPDAGWVHARPPACPAP